MKKKFITFTTDWGTKDYYVGSVKAKLLTELGDSIEIVDISHQIKPLDLQEAAFVLKNCMNFFPKESIHIIGVKAEATKETPHVAVRYNDSWFVSADNGIFTLLFDAPPEMIVDIDIIQDSNFYTFPTLDVFVKVAIMLVKNTPIKELGNIVPNFNTILHSFAPSTMSNIIYGAVCYIDNYGNIITNITQDYFNKNRKSTEFFISFGSNYEITVISPSYGDVGGGELVAVFNTTGNLEIAIYNGNAAELLGIKCNDPIKIIF